MTACVLQLELNNPMYASVLEEAPVNTYVTTVKACDPDSPPNDKMYYFIVREYYYMLLCNEKHFASMPNVVKSFSLQWYTVHRKICWFFCQKANRLSDKQSWFTPVVVI